MKEAVLTRVLIIIFACLFVACNPTGNSKDQGQKEEAEQGEVSSTSFTFNVNNTHLKLNYFSSHDIYKRNDSISRLVIVVHGTGRNPFTYFTNMHKAAKLAGAEDRTLIIAPGFIMEEDLNNNRDLLSDEHIFWTNNGWKQGDESLTDSETNFRTESLSSFEVMDSIVWNIIGSASFPNIEQIVIAGNSAGGQFVNRYLGSNLIHKQVKEIYDIEIKYMIAAPSSYTYLTPERPLPGSPGEFYIPGDTCCNSQYNSYKYGLENLNKYLERSGAAKIREQYGTRSVSYFVGALDNDPEGKSLDRRCEAMLQGKERRERAELFNEYLFYLYGKRWPLTIVPEAEHDHALMFASKEGREWLFN